MTFIALVSLFYLLTVVTCSINVQKAQDVKGRDHIDFYVKSWPVGVVSLGSTATDLFGDKLAISFNSIIKQTNVDPYLETEKAGKPRGLPPSNWVKFQSPEGELFGLFSYKTINHCDQAKVNGSILYDNMNINLLRLYFNDRPEEYYMSRTALGKYVKIHSLTTESAEMYLIDNNIHSHLPFPSFSGSDSSGHDAFDSSTSNSFSNNGDSKRTIPPPTSYANLTSMDGAHADSRVILMNRKCPHLMKYPVLSEAVYIFAGAARAGKFWQEKQYMSIMDKDFNILRSWILFDPHPKRNSPTKPQKNWLPFWDGCKLMYSKRYAPFHAVGEFDHWHATGISTERGSQTYSTPLVPVDDIINTPSPVTFVPNPYLVRGSAPVVYHPRFGPEVGIGCVHLRGRFKIYRHALYLMNMKYPYDILAFSPLFAMDPYRDIEFVMSIFVRGTDVDEQPENIKPKANYNAKDGWNPIPYHDDVRFADGIELTHGSQDCEPRISVIPWSQLKELFSDYVLDAL